MYFVLPLSGCVSSLVYVLLRQIYALLDRVLHVLDVAWYLLTVLIKA